MWRHGTRFPQQHMRGPVSQYRGRRAVQYGTGSVTRGVCISQDKKYTVIGLAVAETKSDCAGEDQQTITRPHQACHSLFCNTELFSWFTYSTPPFRFTFILHIVYLKTISVAQTVWRIMTEWKRIMKWRGHGKRHSWPNFRYDPNIVFKDLRKPTKCWVGTAGASVEIRIYHMTNISENSYRFIHLVRRDSRRRMVKSNITSGFKKHTEEFSQSIQANSRITHQVTSRQLPFVPYCNS
jgi:hypothetical protein